MQQTSGGAPAGRPFYGRVEALRGLGALVVAGFHMTGGTVHGVALGPHVPWAGVGGVQNALGRLGLALVPGHAAVLAFFVICGFVLRVALGHGPRPAGAAAAKLALARVFRIYPVVVVSVLLTPVLLGTFASTAELTPGRLLENLLLLDVSLRGELWALQVELAAAPVILGLFLLERRLGPGVLVAALAVTTPLAVFVPEWAGWRAFSVSLFAFVLGMLVPTAGRAVVAGWSRRAAGVAAAAATAGLALAGPVLGYYSPWGSAVVAYGAAVLVGLAAYRTDLGGLRVLDARPLRLLGRVSGSYYVLHMLSVPAALAAAEAIVPAGWSRDYPAAVAFLVIPLWLAALVPVAVVGFHAVEAPGIALGRRAVRACGLDRPAAAAPPPPVEVRRAA